MTYTGGLGGASILFIIPCIIIIYARKTKITHLYEENNFNKCFFQHMIWPYLGLGVAVLAIGVTIYGLVTGNGGE
jgi:hypothetical protein